MPKIIENLEDRLVEEAGRQIENAGYSAMTIRSVAAGCGVGVGTVYNYFPSKDALAAAYMLNDWHDCLDVIRTVGDTSENPEQVVRCIWEQLSIYAVMHSGIIRDKSAAAGFAGAFSKYHALLRSQLAVPLRKFCSNDFSAEFIAESLLTWTMAGRDFEEIYSVIEKII